MINVTPPLKSLSGKTYGIHPGSNLLCMTNATWRDIVACRGLLLVTSTGWLFALGQAYLDLATRIQTRLGREINSLNDYLTAPELLENARYAISRVQIEGTKAVRRSVSAPIRIGLLTGVAAYAVPHRGITGYGVSSPSNGSLSSSIGVNNTGPGLETDQWRSSGGLPLGSGYGEVTPAGFVLSSYGASWSYAQMIDAVLNSIEDADGIKSKASMGVVAVMAALNINIHSRVQIPLTVFTSGRVTNDFAFAPMQCTNDSGRTGANVSGFAGDVALPLLGGRLKYGDGDYRCFSPFSCTSFTAPGVPFYGYSDPVTGLPSTLEAVTSSSLGSLAGIEPGGVCGWQPFGVFYNIDGGVYTRKAADPAAIDIASYLKWITWGYDIDGTELNTTGMTAPETLAAQTAMVARASTSGGHESNTGSTVADTWMLTPRTLVRLILDPISIEGNSAIWRSSIAEKILRPVSAS